MSARMSARLSSEPPSNMVLHKSKVTGSQSKWSVVSKWLIWLPSALALYHAHCGLRSELFHVSDVANSGHFHQKTLASLGWSPVCFLACRNHLHSYSKFSGICFRRCLFFFFFGDKRVLISRSQTVASPDCDVPSNPAPPGVPDLKSKHTALLRAMLSCRRNSCLHESLMYAHIGMPLKQMRMWRITSIPDLSFFKSQPFLNVKRLIHWSAPLKNVIG